jgi:hypothetical protein
VTTTNSTAPNALSVVININTVPPTSRSSTPATTSLSVLGKDVHLRNHTRPGRSVDASPKVIPTDVDGLRCQAALQTPILLEVWAVQYTVDMDTIHLLQVYGITGPCTIPWLSDGDLDQIGMSPAQVILLEISLVQWLLDGSDVRSNPPS